MKHFILFFIITVHTAFGWGSTGHKIINKNAVKHLPPSMKQFIDQQSFLEQHSTDPDTRRNSSDTSMFSEQYRHYLDVDDYPNFKQLERNFNSLIATYGWKRVKENGTNPWAVVQWMDSLTAQLKRGDWNTSYQTAADIGHYVADPHQPLHATINYDGKLTGNNGIHSRYESTMINSYQSEITITKDTVRYIEDIYGFVFAYIIQSNALIDSIFRADNAAKALTGGSYSSQYYASLWQQLGTMTKAQFQLATIDLASLWYTAWVNAGLLEKPTGVRKVNSIKPESFNLYQNFPNPFNPKTTIHFDIAKRGKIKLDIVSLDGKRIASLVNNEYDAGSYSADWDASHVASGMYLYRLESDHFTQTRKLLFVK